MSGSLRAPAGVPVIDVQTGQPTVSWGEFFQDLADGLAGLQAIGLGLAASPGFANDAAAHAGGVPIGGFYRNGNLVQVRVT